MKLSVEINASPEVTVATCRGRIVFRDEAEALASALLKTIPFTRQLVLDLSAVEMIDNFGLGELLLLWRTAQDRQCLMALAAPGAQVREMLELTRLDTVFEVYPTLEDALSSARAATV